MAKVDNGAMSVERDNTHPQLVFIFLVLVTVADLGEQKNVAGRSRNVRNTSLKSDFNLCQGVIVQAC